MYMYTYIMNSGSLTTDVRSSASSDVNVASNSSTDGSKRRESCGRERGKEGEEGEEGKGEGRRGLCWDVIEQRWGREEAIKGKKIITQ